MKSKGLVSQTMESAFADVGRQLGLPVSNFIKFLGPTPRIQYKTIKTAQGIKYKWVGNTPMLYSIDVTLPSGQVKTLHFSARELISRTRFELMWVALTSRCIDVSSHREWRLVYADMLPLFVEQNVGQLPQ